MHSFSYTKTDMYRSPRGFGPPGPNPLANLFPPGLATALSVVGEY